MRLADERGVTLIELLVVMAVSIVVLSATLTTFSSFVQADQDNNARNDSAEQARNALDVQARQLRNLAKRVASPVIDTVLPDDLIFQTNDPARTWVRYCLQTWAPSSPERGRIWVGALAVPNAATPSPVTAGMRGACPGTGWTSTRVVADHVTNRAAAMDRPLFEYGCTAGTTCTSNVSAYDQIINITARTVVDTTPSEDPAELRVISSVHLRNQNQPPLAGFHATPSSASRTVALNASGSSDFEGRTMNYYWFKGPTMPAVANINCAQPTPATTTPPTLWGAGTTFLGEGITLSHTFPPTDGPAGSMRTIGLVVCDPGDRIPSAGVLTQSVQIPS